MFGQGDEQLIMYPARARAWMTLRAKQLTELNTVRYKLSRGTSWVSVYHPPAAELTPSTLASFNTGAGHATAGPKQTGST